MATVGFRVRVRVVVRVRVKDRVGVRVKVRVRAGVRVRVRFLAGDSRREKSGLPTAQGEAMYY